MRNNLPISGTEYVLQDGEKLISTSNTAGCIICANRSFFEISGYSEDELIGQPHNIICHPDTPSSCRARGRPQRDALRLRLARERALDTPSLASAALIDGARSASKLLPAANGNTHTWRPQ